mgnify:CR=1 FL=1
MRLKSIKIKSLFQCNKSDKIVNISKRFTVSRIIKHQIENVDHIKDIVSENQKLKVEIEEKNNIGFFPGCLFS